MRLRLKVNQNGGKDGLSGGTLASSATLHPPHAEHEGGSSSQPEMAKALKETALVQGTRWLGVTPVLQPTELALFVVEPK
jgi:hypothetical protein